LDIKVIIDDITRVRADAIIVNLFDGTEVPGGATGAVDKALGGIIVDLIKAGEIKGKLNELTVIHTYGKLPARVVAVAGLGKQDGFTLNKTRILMAQACRRLRKLNCKRIATILHGAGVGNMDYKKTASAIVEGSLLGLYRFRKYMTEQADSSDVSELIVVERESSKQVEIEQACREAKIVSKATILARDIINEPANFLTPGDMTDKAGEISRKYGLALTVFDIERMKQEGMGALLGVAKGSEQPPKFIILSYKGAPNSEKILGLVGKAITFDSGGISLKPPDNMKDMKGDMAGGAAVMAAMAAIAQLKPAINITALIPSTENLPSGNALKPGDVLKALNGKTIEIISTDAEGRLIMADALSYAVKQGFAPLVDIATLTGACKVALGDVCSGIMGNNQQLVNRLQDAGAQAGERLWQFPMYEEYKELNKSDVADIKNTGGRYAGTITAGQFLSEFVGETDWAHIDIASTDQSDKEQGYIVKGATGVGVRTLINFIMEYASNN
jgi:leucyl aminopeptidase